MKNGWKYAAIIALILVAYYAYKLYRYMSNREFEYFSYSEFDSKGAPGSGAANMDADFIRTLDKVRKCAGFPFVITSGYRTPEHNASVGGVPGSSHTKGLAVDIAAPTTAMKDKIVECAAANGITRIGYGRTFIHLDVDPDKAQYAIWGYPNQAAPHRYTVWPHLA